MTNISPSLPPLYFHEASEKVSNENANASLLPAEVLHSCLTHYADWGDLARLACVQRQWSGILYDAGNESAEAKWELAQALLNGEGGLEANPTQAMKILLELANLPVDAQNMPHKRDSVSDDVDENDEYHVPAMKQIAVCYLSGEGVAEANATAGIEWMQAAHAWGNDVDAAHELALIYEHGRFDVQVDVMEAVAWFHKAAEGGHTEAMAEVGLCYELGLAVEQSDEMALDWYMKAAEKGHLTAKYSVGEIYEEARGVPQSDEEACLWYYKAAIEGDEDSRKALRRLEDIARIILPGVGRLFAD